MNHWIRFATIFAAVGLFACGNDSDESAAVDPQGSDLVTSSTDDELAAEQSLVLKLEYPVYELDGAVTEIGAE